MTGDENTYRLVRLPGAAIVELVGAHDLSTVSALREVFSLLVTGPDLIVVDVTETEFIDMSVLGGLVSLDRDVQKRGGQFRLQLGPSRIVWRVLEITGLFYHFEVVQTREAALRLISRNAPPCPRSDADAT
ncbi:MAG: STAS domain-containing protein [Pseudonocardia sp.]|nr:STAS domain-containing protein [Pseudonocardia sp.]